MLIPQFSNSTPSLKTTGWTQPTFWNAIFFGSHSYTHYHHSLPLVTTRRLGRIRTPTPITQQRILSVHTHTHTPTLARTLAHSLSRLLAFSHTHIQHSSTCKPIHTYFSLSLSLSLASPLPPFSHTIILDSTKSKLLCLGPFDISLREPAANKRPKPPPAAPPAPSPVLGPENCTARVPKTATVGSLVSHFWTKSGCQKKTEDRARVSMRRRGVSAVPTLVEHLQASSPWRLGFPSLPVPRPPLTSGAPHSSQPELGPLLPCLLKPF